MCCLLGLGEGRGGEEWQGVGTVRELSRVWWGKGEWALIVLSLKSNSCVQYFKFILYVLLAKLYFMDVRCTIYAMFNFSFRRLLERIVYLDFFNILKYGTFITKNILNVIVKNEKKIEREIWMF